jgi:hypothetical protein
VRLLVLVASLLLAGPAAAQVLEIGPQDHWPHTPNAPGHWYPQDCCSFRDCEPTPIEAIEYLPDGWRVRYVSKRLGVIDEYVPKNHEKVKPNEHDGQFHGCWSTSHPDRHSGGTASGVAPASRLICFFYPLWS